MNTSRVVSVLFLWVGLAQLGGCYSYQTPGTSSSPRKEERGERRFLVVLADGRSMELTQVAQDSVAITGQVVEGSAGSGPVQVTVPLDEVARIYERRFDFFDTMGLLTVCGVLGVAGFYLVVFTAMAGGS